MLYKILNSSFARLFVVCATRPNVQCFMLKAGVIHVYVAMWCKGFQLRSSALFHGNLYLETQYSAATNRMSWVKQKPHLLRAPSPAYLHILPCSRPAAVAVEMLIARTT